MEILSPVDGSADIIPRSYIDTPKHVKLNRVTNQSIANGAWAAVQFVNELLDPNGWWVSGTPTRISPAEAGIYLFTMQLGFAINATGVRMAGFQKSGSSFEGQQAVPAHATYNGVLNVAMILDLSGTDYVEAMAFQSSGAALNVTSCLLSAVKL